MHGNEETGMGEGMGEGKKTCFVVMGFHEKTDYKTSRVLDLDKTYKHIIKKAVIDAGLECIRADEIVHAGTIDVPMYEMLLDADLVIADLSTSNLNAAYELGVRHALKPNTTLVIAEDQFVSPFDVSHIVVRKFRHDGKALDIDVAEAFRAELAAAIKSIMAAPKVDSPVYTFLHSLQAPSRRQAEAAAALAAAAAPAAPAAASLSSLMESVRHCKAGGDYTTARLLLQTARAMAPHDSFVVQQLALVTYKGKQPDEKAALEEARGILQTLDPLHSNNAETLGLWGAIHKRLYGITGERAALDASIYAYEKGYRLLTDHYNGINWAFLLNMRAAATTDRAEAIADFVLARRTRADVLALCTRLLPEVKVNDDTRGERYWLMATAAEAAVGLGDETTASSWLAQAVPLATEAFMLPSTTEQLGKLRTLLADSPLRWIMPA
jgi:hypothetical protein